MNLLQFQFQNVCILFRKYKGVTVLMVSFLFCSLVLVGNLVDMASHTEQVAEDYSDTYGNKEYYYTGESLSDIRYAEYMDGENSVIFQRLAALEEELRNAEEFRYVITSDQPLYIRSPKPADCFLLGYEEGMAETAKGEDGYTAKALEVSASFFEEYGIRVAEGEGFASGDFKHSEGDEVPVLLGSDYQKYMKIGDRIEGAYLCETVVFVVKGFLEDTGFFYSRSSNDMVSCSRYMVVPAFTPDRDGELAKYLLMQELMGTVSSDIGYEETLAIFEGFRKEAGVAEEDVYFVYPKAAMERESIFSQYAAMTESVADQFARMLGIMLLFGSITAAMTMCSMLRDNRYLLAVELLCGAKRRNLWEIAAFFVFLITLAADSVCVCLMLLLHKSSLAFGAVQLVCLFVNVVVSGITAVYIAKMPVQDIIGGNE